jgi:lysylphosphatidylglycerol synthetase-like protein (DUF2156 family)
MHAVKVSLQTLGSIVSIPLTLTIVGLTRPERQAWFLLLIGGLVIMVTSLWIGSAPRLGRGQLPTQLTAWIALLIAIGWLERRVWRPQAERLSVQTTIDHFLLPLVMVIALAIGGGLVVGVLLRFVQRQKVSS